MIVPPKKNYIPQFLKQRDINSYTFLIFGHAKIKFFLAVHFCCVQRLEAALAEYEDACSQAAAAGLSLNFLTYEVCAPVCLSGGFRFNSQQGTFGALL